MASAPRSESHSAVPALTPERPVIWPPRVHTTLSNGLEVVLVESHTIPKFTGELFFRSGNAVTAATAPGLADMTATVVRTGTAARTSRQIEEDLRRMGADLVFRRRRGHQRDFLRRAGGFFERAAGAGFRTGAAGFLSRGRIRTRAAPTGRRLAHRAHHARLSGQRALAPRAVRRASVRHDFAHRSAGRRLPPRAAHGFLPRSTTARATRCW